ncbi:uncharacterized protein E0L32_007306 [Thyridium curvatum]|uniref:Non-structural maintenance of chromosomes element 1 homolog n=1 Tax=Thyridium curvatum TaxID=1093900 RepID=A0A507AWA2_9PEZI|nr:uncharacterized protein E0L32_007306 [Thyridium curvatum]TPX12003.1 hypothetical protein E0L32_007306 [Thyridium curvatum]
MQDWEPPLPASYHDSNRAFLQAFMARGVLTLDEAKPIIAAILSAQQGPDQPEVDPESITQDDFDAFLGPAREAISPLDFDIRSTKHQVTNQRVWALINTQSDPSTQLATVHTPEEIAFTKRLLDAMFETYNTPRMEVMCVTEAQALKLARPTRPRESLANRVDGAPSQTSTDRGLKHSEVLALLPSLVEEGWLEKSREGFYSLSPRSLLELWTWLNASYNDPDAEANEWQRIKFCEACKEIVTVGQRCAERDCLVRLHETCQEAFWRSRRDRKCPKCDTHWDGKHFVGEPAVTQTEAFQKNRRKGGGRRSEVINTLMQEDGDGDEEEAEEASAMG